MPKWIVHRSCVDFLQLPQLPATVQKLGQDRSNSVVFHRSDIRMTAPIKNIKYKFKPSSSYCWNCPTWFILNMRVELVACVSVCARLLFIRLHVVLGWTDVQSEPTFCQWQLGLAPEQDWSGQWMNEWICSTLVVLYRGRGLNQWLRWSVFRFLMKAKEN